MNKSKLTKVIGLCLSLTLAFGTMQGCGAAKDSKTENKAETKTEEMSATEKVEDILSEMKEFSNPDKTASLHLNKNWIEEDLGVESSGVTGWMCVRSQDNREAVIMMQFPKGSSIMPVTGIDDVKSLFAEAYSFTETSDEAEVPEIPGMTDISVAIGTIKDGTTTCKAFTIYGETEYAYYALMYGGNVIDDEMLDMIAVSCSTFKETAPEIEDNTTVTITDTVRWFNASYAILTEINGWDYNRFAGVAANEDSKQGQIASLEEWWGVTDRATADENLDWILSEGHRKQFAEDMALFESLGIKDAADRKAFILENFDITEEEAQSNANAYAYYEQYGASAIDGWDYCRAMNLLTFYYLAGYYTEAEALDKSLEIAQTMQPLFDSWDSLADSYLRGYEYWAGESADERRAIYDDLKTRDDNPYAVDYNMTLEKTW